jgi:hypothetical protein
MKQLVLVAALAIVGNAAYGQGLIQFNNNATITGIPGGARIYFDAVGVPANLVSGTQARAGVIAGLASATPYTLSSAGVGMSSLGYLPATPSVTWVNFRTGTSTISGAGFVSVGTTVNRKFDSIPYGANIIYQMVAWTGNYTTWESAWAAAQVDPTVKIGMTLGLTGKMGSSDLDTTLPHFENMASFALTPVPEPATAAIIGMGLASLLVLRRRK